MRTFNQYIRGLNKSLFGIRCTPQSFNYNYGEMRDMWIHQLNEIRQLQKENRKLKRDLDNEIAYFESNVWDER